MDIATPKITPFLWFEDQAEDATNFYVSLFDNSGIDHIQRYPEGPMAGKVLTAIFRLAGQRFMALDGGPQYRFTEAISLFVNCDDQDEIDRLWDKLSEGGEIQMCGWLKDRYGLSWQIVPAEIGQLMGDPDPERGKRVMDAMLQMKKFDIATLRRAHAGVG